MSTCFDRGVLAYNVTYRNGSGKEEPVDAACLVVYIEHRRSNMLFSELKIGDIVLRNRIAVSPMCQYSSEDGFANDWHFVHLGTRAVGGAALVMTEAAAVEARGRISPADLGIWKDDHIESLARIAHFIKEQGAVPAIQLAHAGRKASTRPPWEGGGTAEEDNGGWQVVAPSEIAFASNYPNPRSISASEVGEIARSFAAAARRALDAGFEIVEIHAAHGYLLHEFLSPLSNTRNDEYGGTLVNRMRAVREVAQEIRKVWPERLPLFTRISATDWVDGGWNDGESVELARALRADGVDLIDCSSGGNAADARIPFGPGYQTRFAEKIRAQAEIATGAVGMITSPQQADHIIRTRQADIVLLARQLLRDPYWPLRAAAELGGEVRWPKQYLRAKQ